METCVVCKGSYKKGRGLKIHQKKSGCFKKLADLHRNKCKSEAPNTQEPNHSDVRSQVDQNGEATETSSVEGQVKNRGEKGQDRQIGEKKEEPEDGGTRQPKGEELGQRNKTREGDALEIHVEPSLYAEVDTWLNTTVQDKNPDTEQEMKKTNQEDIRSWLKRKELRKETISADELLGDTRRVLVKENKDPKKQLNREKASSRAEEPPKDTRRVLAKENQDPRKQPNLDQMCPEEDTKQGETKDKQDIRTWLETGKAKTEAGSKPDGQKRENTGDTRRVLAKERDAQSQVEIMEGPANVVLSKHGLHLTRGDFRSLADKNYLNDKIIEEYLRLIASRNEDDSQLPTVYSCSVFLYKQLDKFGLDEGWKRTKRWIREDITAKDYVLFPIHNREHWTLIVVEPSKRTVHYLDSLLGSRHFSAAPRMIKAYMERRHKEIGEKAEYKVKIREDLPLQTNGVDCGVFVCQYAERLTRQAAMDFRQEDMAEARKEMTEELLMGKIMPRERKEWDQSKPREKKKESAKIKKNQKASRKEDRKSAKEGKKKAEGDKAKGGDEGRKERINWPSANSKEWERLDEDLTPLLQVQAASAENKAVVHPMMIYTLCKERFGVKEGKKKSTEVGPSKRQQKCKKLREEINKLKEAYKEAGEGQKEGIKQLQEEKLQKLRLAKRAETLRKGRKKFSRNCSAFLSQPFDFARNVIAPKPKGNLKSSKEEVENHLQKVHGDTEKKEANVDPEGIPEYPQPQVDFDNEPPSWKEFNNRLRKTRNKSAPGPNGVPYVVYKRCPGVARLLWGYLKGMWKKNSISREWRKAEGVFIPKEEGAEDVEKFRTISLLNVEGKLFFGLKAERLMKFALENKCIDTSIQKGGVPGMAGCLEHTAVISQLIREAKEGKGDLVVTWLDVANAYGSLPHRVIMTALRRANVPDEMCKLVEAYYADVKIRFSTGEFTTEWRQVERGIVTGCTLSVILFALAMTMLVTAAKEETKGPTSATGQKQVNSRLFMDDIVTTTETVVQTSLLINKLIGKLDYAGLTVKPEKCRSLVIYKGKVLNKQILIKSKPITQLQEKSIKYLGKTYSASLDEKEQTMAIESQLKDDIRKIEKCRIPTPAYVIAKTNVATKYIQRPTDIC